MGKTLQDIGKDIMKKAPRTQKIILNIDKWDCVKFKDTPPNHPIIKQANELNKQFSKQEIQKANKQLKKIAQHPKPSGKYKLKQHRNSILPQAE